MQSLIDGAFEISNNSLRAFPMNLLETRIPLTQGAHRVGDIGTSFLSQIRLRSLRVLNIEHTVPYRLDRYPKHVA